MGASQQMLLPGGGASSLVKRYWRIYMTAVNSGGDLYGIQEVEFRMTPGGADVSSSSSPCTASSVLGAPFFATKIVDGDLVNGSNAWASNGVGTQWIYCDLGSSFDLQEMAIMPYTPGPVARTPMDFLIEWSPDAVTWNTAKSVTGATVASGWAVGVFRTFSIP